MRYLIIVPAGARRLSRDSFAIESAFAEHLRELRRELAPRFSEIVVAMTLWSDSHWQAVKGGCTVLDEQREGIRLEGLYDHEASKLEFAKQSPQVVSHVVRLVRESHFVHSNFSHDLFRPMGAIACAAAVLLRKPCISVTDIDNRRDAEMNLKVGRWSRRVYAVAHYVYDPLRDHLQRAYVQHLDMVLFKEVKQVEDYGRGAAHVRFFLDPNFSEEHVLDDTALEVKTRELEDAERPLRLLYFGRLVPYKGVDLMLRAVALARSKGAVLTFEIMGDGPERAALTRLVSELGLDEVVSFLASRPYGEQFFSVLHARDVLLACPLSADTPRSTWDALASGMPLVAFDTPFYASMASFTQAVFVTEWPKVEPFAEQLRLLAEQKQRLALPIRAGVLAARQNTGRSWLKRRVAWVEELMEKHYGPLPEATLTSSAAASAPFARNAEVAHGEPSRRARR